MISAIPSTNGYEYTKCNSSLNNIGFSGKTMKKDTVEISKKEVKESHTSSEKSNLKKQIIGSTLLLLGGAALGYGHRKYIYNGINSLKEIGSKIMSKELPSKILAKGKELIGKFKNLIFAK